MAPEPDHAALALEPVPSFRARLRLLRNKRYDEWYFSVIGGPISVLLNACIAEVRWITPNALTLTGFAIRLLALPIALERTFRADCWAAALLLVSTILDCMDGGLARYRKQLSVTGAFLDKATDLISFLCLNGVLGYRAFLETGSLWTVYAGAFIGLSYASRCYNYWIVAYYEKERGAPATVGPRVLRPLGDLTFRERLSYYLGCTRLLVELGEGDIYLWFSLGLVLGQLPVALAVVSAGMALWYVVYYRKRLKIVMRLDEARGA
jgi:phosphatidylglycerophosphate synthase